MKVSDVFEVLQVRSLTGPAGLEREVDGAYMSDLLSDVMGKARENQIWITLQTHRNAVAVASLKDLAAIILVNDNQPDEDMLVQAREDGLPVGLSSLPAFELAGKLYNLLGKA